METKVIEALNEQINFELYSAFLYLSLSLVMEENYYKGYAAWLAQHYEEELDHAKTFINYMHKRGVKPTLHQIDMAEVNQTEPLQVAKAVLEHEQKVSQRIYNIHDLAKQANDYATEIFMHEFIAEQTEEEDVTREIVDRFTLAGDNVSAKMGVDRELGCKTKALRSPLPKMQK